MDRTWSANDKVVLALPMQIGVQVWKENRNTVSVSRGPLTYSLKIGERWVREGGTDEFPAQEVYATTPWNYGLVVNLQKPEESFQVVKTGKTAATALRRGGCAHRACAPKAGESRNGSWSRTAWWERSSPAR